MDHVSLVTSSRGAGYLRKGSDLLDTVQLAAAVVRKEVSHRSGPLCGPAILSNPEPRPCRSGSCVVIQTSRLGATDLEVSRLGLGTVEIGLPYGIGLPDPPPDSECIELLHAALDHGITYFDTAAAYGRSEDLLGKAFSGMGGARPVIATKTKLGPGAAGESLQGPELVQHLRLSIEQSLRRLQVERLDLVQIYVDEETFASESVLSPLVQTAEELTAEGLVRHWGATSYGGDTASKVLHQGPPFQTIQVAYNLLDRSLERAVLPQFREARLGVVIRSVFLQGVLSHRVDRYPEHMDEVKQTARRAAAMVGRYGITLPECALRFVVFGPAQPHVTLFGTFAKNELEQNIAAVAAGPLPQDLMDELSSLAMDGSGLLSPTTWGLPRS